MLVEEGGQDRPSEDTQPDGLTTVVLLSRNQLRRLRCHLLRLDGREYMAYAFCHRDGGAPETLRVTELMPALEDDYRSHGPGHIRLAGDFQTRAKSRCRALGPDAVIQIHSHPFAWKGRFSPIDDRDFPEIAYDFGNAQPGVRCGRWVWGRRLRHSRLEMGSPGSRRIESLRVARLQVVDPVLRESALRTQRHG